MCDEVKHAELTRLELAVVEASEGVEWERTYNFSFSLANSLSYAAFCCSRASKGQE